MLRQAIDDALHDRGVDGAVVEYKKLGSEQPQAEFSISVRGKTMAQIFTYQELEDSGEAIDAPAALKVRMMVSHFVR